VFQATILSAPNRKTKKLDS